MSKPELVKDTLEKARYGKELWREATFAGDSLNIVIEALAKYIDDLEGET